MSENYRPVSNARLIVRVVVAASIAGTCSAADFSLSATIRAGTTTAASWELGIGPAGNSASGTASLQPYYPNDQPRQFALGYTNATNTAFLRYTHASGVSQQVTYSPGGLGLGAGATWTIPTGALSLTAQQIFWSSSATIANLSLGGGISVLQPFATTTLIATRGVLEAGDSSATTSPVVFRTGASGDWLLTGTISFGGLAPYAPSVFGFPLGARNSELSMDAGISGSTPEPATSGLLAVGLILIGWFARRKRRTELKG
jgi:hypothetical protein